MRAVRPDRLCGAWVCNDRFGPIWWWRRATSGIAACGGKRTLNQINGVGIGQLQHLGFDTTSATDRATLLGPVGSAAAVQKGITSPYLGFPSNQTVIQALRPFPQYGTLPSLWAPLGDTWYDSLQVKATQRVFHGLDFTYAFTWQKELINGTVCEQCLGGPGPTAVVTDPFNRGINKQISAYSQPLVSVIAANYTTPHLRTNAVLSGCSRLAGGMFLNYSSGMPIQVPAAQNALATLLRGATVTSSRIPGVPLFTQDLNCHCFDPAKEFVLNKNAWQDPASGVFGTAAPYYNDYRYQRAPQENVALSRTFAVKERVRAVFRVEFTNMFNRLRVPQPTATNALATSTFVKDSAGQNTSQTLAGFGRINTVTAGTGQRTAQALVRITF